MLSAPATYGGARRNGRAIDALERNRHEECVLRQPDGIAVDSTRISPDELHAIDRSVEARWLARGNSDLSAIGAVDRNWKTPTWSCLDNLVDAERVLFRGFRTLSRLAWVLLRANPRWSMMIARTRAPVERT
jgi:hypothetical protein